MSVCFRVIFVLAMLSQLWILFTLGPTGENVLHLQTVCLIHQTPKETGAAGRRMLATWTDADVDRFRRHFKLDRWVHPLLYGLMLFFAASSLSYFLRAFIILGALCDVVENEYHYSMFQLPGRIHDTNDDVLWNACVFASTKWFLLGIALVAMLARWIYDSKGKKTRQDVLILGRGLYTMNLLQVFEDFANIRITLATTEGRSDFAAWSRFVERVLPMPRPESEFEKYKEKILNFIRTHSNVIVLPVGEETIFVSQMVEDIQTASRTSGGKVRICVSPSNDILELHDKFRFQKRMSSISNAIPLTTLVKSNAEARQVVSEYFKQKSVQFVILKPVFGCGQVDTMILSRNSVDTIDSLQIATARPYVVQEFIEGLEYSSLSYCFEGKVIAHACYKPMCASQGSGFFCLRTSASTARQKSSLEIVQALASSMMLTGFFGFDFMERFSDGALVALECNPRVTNGLAFMASKCSPTLASGLRKMLLGHEVVETLAFPGEVRICTGIPLAGALLRQETLELAESAIAAYDDIWNWKDPEPFFAAIALLMCTLVRVVSRKCAGQFRGTFREAVKQQILQQIVTYPYSPKHGNDETGPVTVGKETVVDNVCRELTIDRNIDNCRALRVLVTGATGFLGGKLVKALYRGTLNDDDSNASMPFQRELVVRITATGRNAQLGETLVNTMKTDRHVSNPGRDSKQPELTWVQADLCDAVEVSKLVRGHDIIFHCAALCEPSGKWEAFQRCNVIATQNIVHACQGCVRLLVHVSSPSVAFGLSDTGDRFRVNENDPVPAGFDQVNRYAFTKRLAETVVMDVAARCQVPCIILRPRAVFGPGDTTLLPMLLDRLRRGRLRIIGNDASIQDFTYVDNVVYACLCCLPLSPVKPRIYYITNDEPWSLWKLIKRIADAHKLPLPTRRVPKPIAFFAACVCEWYAALRMLFSSTTVTPIISRYAVSLLSRSVTLDITAAKKDLGYRPIVSMEVGVRRTVEHLVSVG